jgi:AcrR family transcriptional regulator
MQRARTSPRPRERIVTTARGLFHELGIRAVGIDMIAEEAGTNKTTLYRHFTSKDDLITECLRCRAQEARQSWAEIESHNPDDGLSHLRRWVAGVEKRLADDARGCAFANAAVELTEDHPARKFIVDFKTEYRDWLAKLCRGAGIKKAELLADTLMILLDGVRTNRQSVGPLGPSSQFRAMAEAVIDSFRR